jgi:hypothetical protein
MGDECQRASVAIWFDSKEKKVSALGIAAATFPYFHLSSVVLVYVHRI